MQRMLLLVAILIFSISADGVGARDKAEDCSAENALPVTVEEAVQDMKTLRFRCVSITGLIDGRMVWANKEAVIAPVEYDDEEQGPTLRVQFERGSYPTGRDGPLPGKVTGILDHCGMRSDDTGGVRESVNENGEKEIVIVMLTGTCHYTSDAVILPTGFTFDSLAVPKRFTAETLPRERWTIRPANLSDEDGERVKTRAIALLSALAEDDEAMFYAVNEASKALQSSVQPIVLRDKAFGNAKLQVGDEVSTISRYDLDKWIEARKLGEDAQEIISEPDLPFRLFSEANPYDEDGIYVAACWCKTPDCTGKWPVTWVDANANHARPYLCVTADEHRNSESSVISVEVDGMEYGFAEPDWEQVNPQP